MPTAQARPVSPIRILTGLMLAPPIGAYLFTLSITFVMMIGLAFEPGRRGEPIVVLLAPLIALLGVVVGALPAYCGMIVVGLPSFLALRVARAESWWAYAMCGFCGGAGLVALLGRAGFPVERTLGVAGQWYSAGYAGLLVMIAFWAIARRRRRRDM